MTGYKLNIHSHIFIPIDTRMNISLNDSFSPFAHGTLSFSNELMSHVPGNSKNPLYSFLSIPFMSSRESWWKSLSLHLNILLTIKILYFWASAGLSLMIIGSLRLLSLVCPTINPKKVTSLDNHERIIARKY